RYLTVYNLVVVRRITPPVGIPAKDHFHARRPLVQLVWSKRRRILLHPLICPRIAARRVLPRCCTDRHSVIDSEHSEENRVGRGQRDLKGLGIDDFDLLTDVRDVLRSCHPWTAVRVLDAIEYPIC